MVTDAVELCSTGSGPEASIIQSILDGAGITYVMDAPYSGLHGGVGYYTHFRPITFYVRREDYNKSQELLEALSSD